MNASDPRWLTAQEQDGWRSLAAVLFTLPTALDTALQREARITHFEYVVLATLAEAPRRTRRMSDLATLTSGSLSRLSHVGKRLERGGGGRRGDGGRVWGGHQPNRPRRGGATAGGGRGGAGRRRGGGWGRRGA